MGWRKEGFGSETPWSEFMECAVLAHRLREDGETEVLRQFAALSSWAGRGSRQRGLWDN